MKERRATPPAVVLERQGLRPKKELGQNFLRDEAVVAAILEQLPAGPGRLVEVGPGLGAMTRGLAARSERVVAVELDPEMVRLARRSCADMPAVEVIEGDALRVDLQALVRPPYAIVGNIPYNITGALLPRLVSLDPAPEWVCVMVQLEVAQRLCAEPGAWSLATLGVRAFATAELLMRVPASAFEPPPKVDSAVIMLRPGRRAAFADVSFFDFARAVFQERRKQLPNAVANALRHDIRRGRMVVDLAGLDPSRRPQTLDLEEWGMLYGAFLEAGPGDQQ
ncbi:MAG: 16S rRNA (adenine(1518)-N(6)/adenine(1519)-N(6))-dimethyltransferase RsmA [Candidatus Dormibacteria bacterium]